MTLWDQLGGRTWGERSWSPGDDPGPARRRVGRRRRPAPPRRRVRVPARVPATARRD